VIFKEYPYLSAHEIASHVRAGEVAPAEVLEAALAAIARADSRLNAVVELYTDEAHDQIAQGLSRGPLCGVPLLLKDLGTPARGTRSTFGSALFAQAPLWRHDCAFVEQVRRAGAIVLGRTNSAEFGISLVTEPAFRGATGNPHGKGLSPGGSSGGSAAAVASGMVPVAHAMDGCGSIRVPAGQCGLVGLKPSRGRISFAPDFGESWAGMSVNGALTRSVHDAALMLDVVGVAYPGDPYVAPPPARPFRELLTSASRTLRIGLAKSSDETAIHPVSREAVDAAANLCRALGHEIETCPVELDVAELLPHIAIIWSVQLWSLIEPRYRELGQEPDGHGMEPISWQLAAKARSFSGNEFLAAVRYLHSFSRRYAVACDACDVILSPVSAQPTWEIGRLRTDDCDLDTYMERLFRAFPFTLSHNVTGRPAIAVPLHWNEGVPVGVQFSAKLGEEGTLLQLAAQLEQLAPWHAHQHAALVRAQSHATASPDRAPRRG
jgi:Asp-tRNA(Asn)/Glu-tRNA(Gln) amidotransferase A subunit family amidase